MEQTAHTQSRQAKAAEVPADGAHTKTGDRAGQSSGEKSAALDSQVQELRQNPGQWKGALESGDSSNLDQLGFPQTQVSDATYTKIAGVKEDANIGEFIKRDVSPASLKTTSEQSIMQIAANHLGAGASVEQIKKHASEIYHLNFNSLEKADSVETATAKKGETIRMQGHTAGGAILISDSAKNQYAITEDGKVKVTRIDGTGFERSFTGRDDSYREVHFGPKASDKFTVTKSADGRLLTSDRPEASPPRSASEEKGQLERLIKEKVVLPPENEKFRRNLKEFEERATKDGLSSVEVAKVYRDLSKILDLKGNAPLTLRERVRMAGGAMAAAADPTSNDQGKYNTCQIATIENRLYARQPSVVTDVLSQIAAGGKFITKDGTVAPMERVNLRAHGDAALNSARGSWTRSYASQIFETAAVTAFYTQENLRKMPPGDVHYYQNASTSDYDSGESLIDYSHGKPQEIDRGPGAAGEMNNMIKINEQLTGKWQPEFFMVNKSLQDRSPEHNKATGFGSVDEFAAKLEKLRATEKGPLYATLFVRVNSDPLVGMRKNNPLTGPVALEKIFDDGHVMNIVDYDAKTRMVKLDGQWGNSRDFINKPLTIEQAYAATLPPTGARWMERAAALSKSMAPKEFNAQLANLTNALSLSFTSDMQLDIKVDKEDVRKTIAAYERLRSGRTSPAFAESDENIKILRQELSIQK